MNSTPEGIATVTTPCNGKTSFWIMRTRRCRDLACEHSSAPDYCSGVIIGTRWMTVTGPRKLLHSRRWHRESTDGRASHR